MTRIVVAILCVATVAVALAIAVSERRVQAAFDAVRQESEGQLERAEAIARIESLVRELGSEGAANTSAARARVAAARVELAQTAATLRTQLPAVPANFLGIKDARRDELERLATLAVATTEGEATRDDARRNREAHAAAERFIAAESALRARTSRHAEVAQREATTTLRLALALSALFALGLGLALSLRLVLQATRLANAAERIARGNLEAAVPPLDGALGQLAPAVRRTAAALARRERETDALIVLAALPQPTDLSPASAAASGDGADAAGHASGVAREAQLGRLLESVRQAIAGVLDVRALTLVAVDGERVQRLGTSQRERQASQYPRAGSAVAATLARGDAVVFDVDRGAHPEDASARAAGARAYAVVPLDDAAPMAGALVVDLGLCAVAVAELRFLGLVAHELSARLTRLTLERGRQPRIAEIGRAFRSK